jgi:hypothetical protein
MDPTIKELERLAESLWAASSVMLVKHYEVRATISRLRGDGFEEEFNLALAASYRNEPGATERVAAAHTALQGSRVTA